METRESTAKKTEQAVNNTAMVPKITREQLKMRMAYALYDFWGLKIPPGSKALYEGLNTRGWYWFPSHLHWGQLNKREEGQPDDNPTDSITV